MVKRLYILLFIVQFIFAGCKELDILGMAISSSGSVDRRFEWSQDWNNSHEPRTIISPKDDYKIYVGADIHCQGSVDNVTLFMSEYRHDHEAIFSIILGDLVQLDGYYQTIADVIDDSFVAFGNHDAYFNRLKEFNALFGPTTYCITVTTPNNNDLYIVLDTASGAVGSKQMKWLKKLLETSRQNYRHCIVFTHTNFFYSDFSQEFSGNLPLEETYELCYLFDKYDVELCLQGHDHYRSVDTYKGVQYVVLDKMIDGTETASYLILDCSTEVKYHFIPFSYFIN